MHTIYSKRNFWCENVKFLFGKSEHDVLELSQSWRLTEYEVKVSKSDFKNDFKKKKMWKFDCLLEEDPRTASWRKRNMKLLYSVLPHHFYYVCSPWLININEIPKWAWLIYVSVDKLNNTLYNIEIIKKAPLLHTYEHDTLRIKEKFLRVLGERSIYWWITKVTFDRTKRWTSLLNVT